ncbi:unnamed protein product [Lathyrus oleraceus]
MDVTASASTEVTTLIETRFIALTSTKFSVRTYGGLLGRLSDYSVLTGYADHVAFILWKGEDLPSLNVPTHGGKLKKFLDVKMS